MKVLAIFDFDGTLIKGDSLWYFIAALHGRARAVAMFAAAIAAAPFTRAFYADVRTAIKQRWIHHALRGIDANEATLAAEIVRAGLRWKDPQVQALRRLAAHDATIIIATGALDVYIHILLEGLPVNMVFCTAAERSAMGALTGHISGTNAVRGAKADRIRDYAMAHGPFDKIIGYGNLPNDRAMLELCTEAHVI
jgi:phosphatidylglycerophosphatase C